MEIEGYNKSTFDIVLDGVVYGPFQKVILSPYCVSDNREDDADFVKINVMSFTNVNE